MTIEAEITPADHKAFQRHVRLRYHKLPWMYAFFLLVFGSLTWWGGKDKPVSEKVISVLGLVVVFFSLLLVFTLFVKLMQKLRGGRFAGAVGRHTFEITESGIIETNDQGRTEMKVIGIRAVDETQDHFFVISKAGVGMIVPKRSVGAPDVVYQLRDRVLSRSR